jgi:hypothetical protein
MMAMNKEHFPVTSGNAVQVSIDWFDMDGVPAEPLSVRYQTFDFAKGTALSEIVFVADPAQSMTFIVPTEDVPAHPSLKERHIILQVEGEFSTDVHTEELHLIVMKRYAFSS